MTRFGRLGRGVWALAAVVGCAGGGGPEPLDQELAREGSPKAAVAPPQPEWTLLTSHSERGTFLLGGLEGCWSMPSGVLTPSAGGPPIQPTLQELGPCLVAYTPPEPLAPGEYCVELPAGWSAPLQECFQVTGITPVLAFASLSSELWGDPYDIEGCAPCDDGISQVCTRLHYRYRFQTRLQNVNQEVESTHLFSWTVQQGASNGLSPPPPAADASWGPLSTELTGDVYVDDWSEPYACVGLHARPLAGGASELVATVCEPRPAQFSFPDLFRLDSAYCDSDYAARWCSDNHADCTSSEQPFPYYRHCDDYPLRCEADGTAKPVLPRPDAGTFAADGSRGDGAGPDGTEDDTAEQDAAHQADAFDRPGTHENSSGCSAGSTPSRSWLWLVFAGLAALSATRSRPTRSR